MKTRIELEIQRELSPDELIRVQEVLIALIHTGALFGVRGGKSIIHFDAQGEFQGVQLDYWPWRRRSK